MLGGSGYKFVTNFGCLMYVLTTIQVNISMLNMVIAVTGETYGRLRTYQMENDLIIKARLLLDYSDLISLFTDKTDDYGYLYILRRQKGDDGEDLSAQLEATNNLVKENDNKMQV